MDTKTRNTRTPLPLVRAIAEECARVLGGKASQHLRRAQRLLAESLAAAPRVVPARARARRPHPALN